MSLVAILSAYFIGSLPMGYIFIKLFRRQDVTRIGSGRTGGTNAMRAGGFWIGALTGLTDLMKGYLAVQIARRLVPEVIWLHCLAGFVSVLGHNWSIWLFLFVRKFPAGAGTGPNIGAAMAFWPWVVVVAIPMVLFFVFIVGYASLASLSTAVVVVLVFAIQAIWFGMPWEYVVYGILTFGLVAWALRPNISRLLGGDERRVGFFAQQKSGSGS